MNAHNRIDERFAYPDEPIRVRETHDSCTVTEKAHRQLPTLSQLITT